MKGIKKFLVVLMVFAMTVTMTPVVGRAASNALKLNKTKASITVGKTLQLKVKNLKKNQKVSWSTSNKKVATVSKAGKVTAKKAGTANITAKVGTKKYTCKVTVKKKSSSSASQEPVEQPEDKVSTVVVTPNDITPTLNAADVDALKKIIASQRALGALVSEDITNKKQYEWDKSGRLIEIEWDDMKLSGEISFSELTALQELECDNNQLTGLDVTGCAVLKDLSCEFNWLVSLNIVGCAYLEELECRGNRLTELNVYGCVRLRKPDCDFSVNIIAINPE